MTPLILLSNFFIRYYVKQKPRVHKPIAVQPRNFDFICASVIKGTLLYYFFHHFFDITQWAFHDIVVSHSSSSSLPLLILQLVKKI